MKVTALKQLAALGDEIAHLTARVASQRAEQKATRERAGEDASAKRARDAACEQRRGESEDLQPVWLDQSPARGLLQRDSAERSGADTADEPVADLLEQSRMQTAKKSCRRRVSATLLLQSGTRSGGGDRDVQV
jgi:hypothetical protein